MSRAPTDAELAERRAAFLRIDDPASPDYVPHYARPENRSQWNMTKGLVDAFGTHLICPRAPCGRAGRCADENRRDLPFCFWHYRGAIRYVFMSEMKRRGLKVGETGLRPDPAPGEPEPFPEPPRPPGRSLLEELRDGGADIDSLRRPADAGEDPWDWERDRTALEAYNAIPTPAQPLWPGAAAWSAPRTGRPRDERRRPGGRARDGSPPGARC